MSTPALGFAGIALALDPSPGYATYQVVAGGWPPLPEVDMSSILTVPLLLDDKRIGELTVFRASGEFEEAEAALVTAAAAHASLGVGRARLQEEVKRLRSRATRNGSKRAAKKRKAGTTAKRKSGPTGTATARKLSVAARPKPNSRPRKKAGARGNRTR